MADQGPRAGDFGGDRSGDGGGHYTAFDNTSKKLSMYDFTVDTKPVLTIYDTGTGNTLDLSGFSDAATVDLDDGKFSSVAGLVGNIFIEYGTQIDHAIGGAGNDVFTANTRSDAIDGGAGLHTVLLTGTRKDWVVSFGSGYAVLTNPSTGVVDQFANIQTVTFADNTWLSLPGGPYVVYANGVTGSFGAAANWTGHAIPTAASDVGINNAVVNYASLNPQNIDDLAIGVYGSLDVTNSFLGTTNTSGSFNDGTLTIEAGATFAVAGGIYNDGAIWLYGLFGPSYATLQTNSQYVTLSGGGTVQLAGGSGNDIIGGRSPGTTVDTFINADNTIIGAGTIGLGGTSFQLQFVNSGIVTASGPGVLFIHAGPVHSGFITANTGMLDLGGTIDQSLGGSIAGYNAKDLINLDGVTITNGILASLMNAVEVSNDPTLNGVTLSGNVKIDAGKKLTLIGNITGTNTTIDATAGSIDLSQAHLHNVTLKLPANLNTNGRTLDGGGGTIGIGSPISGNGLTLAGGIAAGWTEGRNPSAYFDTKYYLTQNPDVAAAGIHPLTHFENQGFLEGRNPSAAFDTNDYWAANPDIKALRFEPLLHYVLAGQEEGGAEYAVPTDLLFDATYYYANNADVKAAGLDPLLHFEYNGFREGRDPSLAFSDSKYLAANPGVASSGVNPLVQFIQTGQFIGQVAFLVGGSATADPLVDPAFYDKQLGATIIPGGLAGQQQAAASYNTTGWKAGLNPDAFFDTNYYLSHNPDIAAAHIDPLTHYLQAWQYEGGTRHPYAVAGKRDASGASATQPGEFGDESVVPFPRYDLDGSGLLHEGDVLHEAVGDGVERCLRIFEDGLDFGGVDLAAAVLDEEGGGAGWVGGDEGVGFLLGGDEGADDAGVGGGKAPGAVDHVERDVAEGVGAAEDGVDLGACGLGLGERGT